MLVSGIVIIMLVVSGVSILFVVMQANNEAIDAGTAVSIHNNERVKEDVDIVWDGTDLKMHNAGPETDILEYRVLDDDGTVLRICAVEHEVGASVKNIVNTTKFAECWQEFLT